LKEEPKSISERATRFLAVDMKDRLKSAFNRGAGGNEPAPEAPRVDDTPDYSSIFAHRAQSAQAHAQFDEQVADYRNTVLVAYQEVEDNLAALRQLQREYLSETAAVASTATALQQAQYRYKEGLVTYLEVSIAENAYLQAQITNVTIQLRRMNASVLLVKALGGGWQRSDLGTAATR